MHPHSRVRNNIVKKRVLAFLPLRFRTTFERELDLFGHEAPGVWPLTVWTMVSSVSNMLTVGHPPPYWAGEEHSTLFTPSSSLIVSHNTTLSPPVQMKYESDQQLMISKDKLLSRISPELFAIFMGWLPLSPQLLVEWTEDWAWIDF